MKNNFVFFGTDDFAVMVLENLLRDSVRPILIVTTPDTVKGRGLELAQSPVKKWAKEHDIEVCAPEKLDETFLNFYKEKNPGVTLVTSYGKIIPKKILEIPEYKTFNIHPSLLPLWRGPSPIESAILNDQKTGVSLMLLDEKMDHGQIVDQQVVKTDYWPIEKKVIYRESAKIGSTMFVNLLNKIQNGEESSLVEQNHDDATYCKKFEKKDGEIDMNVDNAETIARKFFAFTPWPSVYFFHTRENGQKVRVIIKDIEFKNGELKILRVLPEGRKEMDYKSFLKGFK